MSLEPVDHAARGVSRLAYQFRGKPNLEGLIRVLLSEVDALEAAIQQVRTLAVIATSVGAQLDVIGARVGDRRNGKSDADYRKWIRARIIANRSGGEHGAILGALRLVIPEDAGLQISHETNASLVLSLGADAAPFIELIRALKGAGIRVFVEYWTGALDETFRFDVGPGFDDGQLAAQSTL